MNNPGIKIECTLERDGVVEESYSAYAVMFPHGDEPVSDLAVQSLRMYAARRGQNPETLQHAYQWFREEVVRTSEVLGLDELTLLKVMHILSHNGEESRALDTLISGDYAALRETLFAEHRIGGYSFDNLPTVPK